VVILYPRVVAAEGVEAPEADAIQQALSAIAERVGEGRPLDVRPEPERVCPRGGCVAPSVGAVLLRAEAGCAVVVTLSHPGETPARLLPWVGELELRNTNVPFRDPPERHITTHDMVRCSELSAKMAEAESTIEEEVTALLRGH
jgi:hypothetical protein